MSVVLRQDLVEIVLKRREPRERDRNEDREFKSLREKDLMERKDKDGPFNERQKILDRV